MSLVDYASSDEGSESEHEDNVKAEKISVEENQPNLTSQNTNKNDSSNDDKNPTLFSTLPKPRTNFSFLGDDNNLSKVLLNKSNTMPLSKKSEKESIKISVPSVSDFDDEKDQPATKKLKPSSKGVGLLSVLPPPKSTTVKESNRALVPQIVAKSQVKQSAKVATVTKNNLKVSNNKNLDMNDDDNEDIAVGSSFFGSSLTESSVSTDPSNASSYENTMHQAQANELNNDAANSYNWNQPIALEESSNYSFNCHESEEKYNSLPPGPQLPDTFPVDNNPLELDEKALQILCGNKKKRQHMPMNIIDLSGEEIMPDSKEWLLKQFTEEKKVRSHSHKKGDGPSSQQRRKHQITYLAYQAKAQELELQNQWAQNRMSRKQTQSKYGF